MSGSVCYSRVMCLLDGGSGTKTALQFDPGLHREISGVYCNYVSV